MSGWRKSTYSGSNGDCIEVAGFRKSSHSAYNGDCVEAGSCRHGVAVRDTQDRDGPVLTFGSEAWSAFTAALKAP